MVKKKELIKKRTPIGRRFGGGKEDSDGERRLDRFLEPTEIKGRTSDNEIVIVHCLGIGKI